MSDSDTSTTRGERMLALRKARMAAGPPIFRGGFRPFFFLGSAWAALALVIWIFAFLGGLSLPSAFDALSWHRHEMLFGFVGAIVAGFLLTAIPNWTGRLPIAGPPLAALAGLWLAARIALYWSGFFGIVTAAVLDVGFYLVFALVAGREVLAAKNRNLPMVVLVLLLGVANAADYAAVAGLLADRELGIRGGIALVVLMISLVGGRIVPSFTRNWMIKKGWKEKLPRQPTRFDQIALAASGVALLAWLVAPVAAVTGLLLILAAALQFVRLALWRGWRTISDPFVLVLHVGYLWIPVGLLLLGMSVLDASHPRTAAVHALTTGAMATMIIAVMTRATLGHTGRELRANAATVAIYILVTLAAIVRVAAPLGLVGYRMGMEAAGALWVFAFLLFVGVYGPILLRARLGQEAG
jgi:uncharacterized protein involved in response to NO